MPDLYAVAREYRARLLSGDNALRDQLVGSYRAILAELRRETTAAVADATANPESVAWRVKRARQLEIRLTQILTEYGADAGSAVTQSQDASALLSVQANRRMLEVVQIGFSEPSKTAIEALAGFASDGSPLLDLFAEVAQDTGAAARDILLTGLALGRGADQIAESLGDELSVPLTRALRIARTETLRAYREGSRITMAANADVVEGWTWLSARDLRTCACCWAMDGHEFPLEEAFYSHVNCRCVAIPEIIGVDDDQETGEEAFAKLPSATQEEILGPGKYALYEKGEITLSDLVEEGTDARWGPYRVERPLRDLRGGAAVRYGGGSRSRPIPPVKEPEPDPEPDKVVARMDYDDAKKVFLDWVDATPDAFTLHPTQGDRLLRKIAEIQGFDGLPHHVTRPQFERYVKSGEEEVVRGVGLRSHAEQFQSGDLFCGYGIFGKGTYGAAGPGAEDLARDFANNKAPVGQNGSLMRWTMRSDARVIAHSDLQREIVQELTGIEREIQQALSRYDLAEAQRLYKHHHALNDQGRYGALKGYDAIIVSSDEARPTYPVNRYNGLGQTHHEYVVLNRTAVRVLDEVTDL